MAALPHRTRIKICGVRDVETALHAAACGADAIGLMRVESSPRYVDQSAALEIAIALPSFVEPVWVYRNEQLDSPLTGSVQLHGDEDAAFVAQVRSALPRPNRIIRAIAFNARHIREWNNADDVDSLLVEGAIPGAGRGFDYTELTAMRRKISKPLILAGGLTPANVADGIRAVRPYAVDVSSGVESERGVKDAQLIEQFCAVVRAADEAAESESAVQSEG